MAELDAVIDRVADGQSFRAACMALGVDRRSAYNLIATDETGRLATSIAGAREAQSEAHSGKAVRIARDVLVGRITPYAGKVALDALKWTVARMAPRATKSSSRSTVIV